MPWTGDGVYVPVRFFDSAAGAAAGIFTGAFFAGALFAAGFFFAAVFFAAFFFIFMGRTLP